MTTTTDNASEIRIIRQYDAPVGVVWDAFTDDAQASQWWGPRGFSITTHSKELRVGGTWVYTMHGPDGKDWPNFTRYLEVEPHARLVYDHGATSADSAPLFRMTVLFRDLGGRTELELCMTLANPEVAQQTRAFIRAAGGNSTWDRLAEYLEKQSTSEEVFVINRTFDAPIDTMFDMFVTPEHFAQWLPPTGFTMSFHRVSIAPGGDAFFTMTNGDITMYGRLEYRIVERPHRIEYAQVFTDEHEQLRALPRRCGVAGDHVQQRAAHSGRSGADAGEHSHVAVGQCDAGGSGGVRCGARRHDARVDWVVRQAGAAGQRRRRARRVTLQTLCRLLVSQGDDQAV